VGREAGSEARDRFLDNEKRTGKSACATQGKNQKSRRMPFVPQDKPALQGKLPAFSASFLPW
jgi:hypothetical protein